MQKTFIALATFLLLVMIIPPPSNSESPPSVNKVIARGSFDHNGDGLNDSQFGLKIIQEANDPYTLYVSEFSVSLEAIKDLVIGDVHLIDPDKYQCGVYDYLDFAGRGTVYQDDGTIMKVYINATIGTFGNREGFITLEVMDEDDIYDLFLSKPFTGKLRVRCGKNWQPGRAQ